MNEDVQEKIRTMQEGGAKLGEILRELLEAAQPGVSLLSLEELTTNRIRAAGGTPSFQTVEGYRWATCLCVNEVVVHGIPTAYALTEGDLLTIDVGMLYKGFHTDTAWTKIVHSEKLETKDVEESKKERFLNIGQDALWQAIAQARPGNRVGHISQAIQKIIEKAGYSIVPSLVGHGVGKKLHEPPQIPGFLKKRREDTESLRSGMTLAIEVIYALGAGTTTYESDGWSIATRDRSLSAVFEHTVAITDAEPVVLTHTRK